MLLLRLIYDSFDVFIPFFVHSVLENHNSPALLLRFNNLFNRK